MKISLAMTSNWQRQMARTTILMPLSIGPSFKIIKSRRLQELDWQELG